MAFNHNEVIKLFSSHPEYVLSGVLALIIMLAFFYGLARIFWEITWIKTQDADLKTAKGQTRLLLSDRDRHLQKTGQAGGPAEEVTEEAEGEEAGTASQDEERRLEEPLLKILKPGGEVPDCIKAAAEGIRQGGEVPPGSLASGLALRLRSRVSDIQFLCGSLILVGLAGTLIGLTLAVIGLKTPDISQVVSQPEGVRAEAPAPQTSLERIEDIKRKEAIRHLYQGIGTTLGGMRTAFIASLFAVVTTIFLNLCFAGLRRRQNSFLAGMEDFIALQLFPYLKPPPAATSFSSLATSFDKSSGLMEAFCQHINAQVAESRANWQMFMEAVRKLDNTKLQIADGIESLRTSQEKLLGTQNEVSNTVKELGQSLAGLSTLGPQTHDLLGRLEILLTAQQDMLGGMDGILDSANLMVETNKSFLRNHEDLFDRRLANLLAQTQSQIQGVLKKEDTHIKVVEERLDSLARSQSSMAASLKLRSDDDRGVADAVQDYLNYRRGQQVVFEQEFLKGLWSFRTALATQPTQYQELTRQLDEVTENLKNREQWWQESLATQRAAFDEALETKLAAIHRLLEELKAVPRRPWSHTTPRYQVPVPDSSFSVFESPAREEQVMATPTSWWGRLKRSVRGTRGDHRSLNYYEKEGQAHYPMSPPKFEAKGEIIPKAEVQDPRNPDKLEKPGSEE
jgi:hypothetical protein